MAVRGGGRGGCVAPASTRSNTPPLQIVVAKGVDRHVRRGRATHGGRPADCSQHRVAAEDPAQPCRPQDDRNQNENIIRKEYNRLYLGSNALFVDYQHGRSRACATRRHELILRRRPRRARKMADTGASTKRSHDHDHPPNEHHKRVRSSNADETGPYASMAAAPPAASPPESLRAKPSFYQRQLPEACVSFSSPHGRRLLMESLSSESLDTHIYFDLSAQFRTQEEPTFCGLSTLVMCLNGELSAGHGYLGHQPLATLSTIWYTSTDVEIVTPSSAQARPQSALERALALVPRINARLLQADRRCQRRGMCTHARTRARAHTHSPPRTSLPAIWGKHLFSHFSPSTLLHGRRVSPSTNSLASPDVTARPRTFTDLTLVLPATIMAVVATKRTVSAAKVVAVPVTRTTGVGAAALAAVAARPRSASICFENRSARRVPRVWQLQSFRMTVRRLDNPGRVIFRPSLHSTRWRTRRLFWMLRGSR